jgi:hypothetical protein
MREFSGVEETMCTAPMRLCRLHRVTIVCRCDANGLDESSGFEHSFSQRYVQARIWYSMPCSVCRIVIALLSKVAYTCLERFRGKLAWIEWLKAEEVWVCVSPGGKRNAYRSCDRACIPSTHVIHMARSTTWRMMGEIRFEINSLPSRAMGENANLPTESSARLR